MTEQEKINALGNYLNYKSETAVTSAVSTPIFDDKKKKVENDILFNALNNSDQETQGLVSNFKVYSQESSDPMSGTELMNEVGEDAMPNIQSMVMQPESMLPYGTRMFQIGDKEYRMEPMLSDKYKPEYSLNMLYRAQQSPLTGFSVTEELPPVPEQYTKPDGTIATNEFGKYINKRGEYKMEYTPNGVNLYRKEGNKEMKLNQLPINIE